MTTFKITVAYDGTDYVGWQRQASGVSIQGLLEDALRALDERDVPVAAAGRTDAGVHALGQVASFTLARALPCDAIVRAVNARLPDAVRVLSAAEAPRSFHARFDARTKTYRYRIWNGDVMPPFERRYAWHLTGPLDVASMRSGRQAATSRRRCGRSSARGLLNARRRTDRAPNTRNAAGRSSRTKSPAMGFSATWSGRSSARSSRSAAGAGRPTG